MGVNGKAAARRKTTSRDWRFSWQQRIVRLGCYSNEIMVAAAVWQASLSASIVVMRRTPARFRQSLLCGRVKSDRRARQKFFVSVTELTQVRARRRRRSAAMLCRDNYANSVSCACPWSGSDRERVTEPAYAILRRARSALPAERSIPSGDSRRAFRGTQKSLALF